MKVWVLSSGEYSDWSIDTIVTSEDVAKEAVARELAEHYDDYEVYDEVPPQQVIYNFHFTADEVVHEWTYTHWPPIKEYSRIDVSEVTAGPQKGNLWARGDDRDKVMKVVRDRQAKMKAEREGIA